ncbi:MAG: D-glycero-beta-D-manno-heptose-7-phosphate kinase [bacterium]|nr:MAG: D-glycero-beta-D-manno-heptose-7-phosphate kinase [bacterium]
MNRLEPEWLDVLLERARQIRVLVVGDLMLDVYLRGSASRISPEAPVPVVRVRERWSTLGGAANVARNVVELGAACELVGCVGADEAGTQLLAEVERAGIGARGITVVADRPTTVKTRLVARNQQIARFDSEVEDDLEGGSADALIAAIDELAAGADVIVLEDYDKGVLTRAVSAAALEAARRRGVPVVVDPKERHFFDYAGATVFKPNLVELTTALRAPVHADDPRWMEETRRRLGCRNLLVTLGEDGLALATEAGEFVRVPTVARSVYDVSGAGDTVTAVVAVALAAGATLPEAAVLANHAAGIQVGKAGVSAVSADELRATVRAYQKV